MFRMKHSLILLAVLVGLGACKVNNLGNTCAVDTDCSDVELCVEGACASACEEVCDEGEVCDQESRSCIGDECTLAADCGPNERCVSGNCVDSVECTMSQDCGEGQSCIDSACIDGQCRRDGDCPGELVCVDNACIPEEGCVVGQIRCNANILITCLAGGEEIEEPCESDFVCLEGEGSARCHAIICEADERSCMDTDTTTTCNNTGTALVDEDCAPAEVCTEGVCGPLPCDPFEIGCADANTAFACDGDGEIELLPCRDDQFCEEALCRDRACTPGQSECVGDTIVTCDEAGTQVERVFCGDMPQCVDVPGGCACVDTTCIPRVCVPGSRRCVGNGSQACSEDGTTWRAREACGDDQECVAGSCVSDNCEGGESLCSGEVLLRCQGEWVADDCGDRGQLCEDGRCQPRACEPGAALCADGDVATRCNVRGDGVEPGTDCGALDLSCIGGECVESCEPGARRCDGDSVHVCLPDGLSEREVPCGDGQICLDGFCRQPVCTPGEEGCDGARVAACNDAGTGYLPGGQDCAALGLRCADAECVEGENECPVTLARAGSSEANVPLRGRVVVVPASAALELDGTESTDDDNVVRVQWRRVDGPGGITLAADLDPRRAIVTQLRPMERYLFEGVAIDSTGLEACEPDFVEVHTVGDEQLIFHLLWDSDDPNPEDMTGDDVDLHLLKARTGLWFEQPFDCHWANQHPDWAPEAPDQVIDDVNGQGPEIIVLDNPSPCEWYALGIHYWRANFGTATAHVNVFNGGQLAWSQWDHVLGGTGAWWEAMVVQWPTGQTFTTGRDFEQPRRADRPHFSAEALDSDLCGIPEDLDE
jgi:hypothetical protein